METDYRSDFPLLCNIEENGRPLAYLDNGATTQKPNQVIDAVCHYYKTYNANPHRGAYAISEQATEAFEGVRRKVARFIGASRPEEIVFTSGTTDAINLVALSYGQAHIEAGDEILVTIFEHHSNLLPWQRLAREKGATLRYLYPGEDGQISPEELARRLTDKTKLVAVTQVSNVLGVVNPVKEICALAHEKGAVVLVDAAQAVPHMPVNVRELDADFLAFSGHKMLAPAGIGVLYGKRALLEEMVPLRLGGGIVEQVTEQTASYLDAPWKFEAGTQNAEGVIGLGAAIDYMEEVGFPYIQAREAELTDYARERLFAIPGVELYGGQGAAAGKGILSFNIAGVHPHDTATILASHGVAVRAGHHCAQPLMAYLGVNATCRMSLYFYNSWEDIDRLADALGSVRGVLGYEPE